MGKEVAQLSFKEALFFSQSSQEVLNRSKHAKALGGIKVSAADVAIVQSGLETLLWQLFDKEMESSGAHLWLQISLEAT